MNDEYTILTYQIEQKRKFHSLPMNFYEMVFAEQPPKNRFVRIGVL